MLRRLLLCWVATLVLHMPAWAGELQAWGYVGWWLPQGWRSVPLQEFERVMFFDLKINPNGTITERHGWPEQWGDLILAAQQSQTPIDLCLTLLDKPTFQKLFSSPSHVQRLRSEILTLLEQSGVSGIHLDIEVYESLDASTVQAFRAFVKDLAANVKRNGGTKHFSAFIPVGGVTALYDAPTAAALDRVVLQGYDAHWQGGRTAGPVAPLDGAGPVTWKKVVAMGKAWGVAPKRLLVSFPLYGYEWRVKHSALGSATLDVGKSTTMVSMPLAEGEAAQASVQEQIQRHGAGYDAHSESAYYQFRTPKGHFMQGWFDDGRTLLRKSEFLVKEEVGGIAFFLLGYDGGQLLNPFFQQRRFSAP
jgi:spore germination protein